MSKTVPVRFKGVCPVCSGVYGLMSPPPHIDRPGYAMKNKMVRHEMKDGSRRACGGTGRQAIRLIDTKKEREDAQALQNQGMDVAPDETPTMSPAAKP